MRERVRRLVVLACVCGALAAVWRPAPHTAPPRPAGPSPNSGYGARSLAKWAVASEVVAGRMSVPEGAAVFGWLDRLPPAAPADPRAALRDSVDDEDLLAARSAEDLLCLGVLVYAAEGCRSAPARLAEVRAEFRRAVGTPGGAVLPPVREPSCRELLARARAAWASLRPGGSGARAAVDVGGLRLVVRPDE